MPIAVNDKGEIVTLDDSGAWVPAQRAVNPQTGQKLVRDGASWVPEPGPDRSTAARIGRGVVMPAEGFNESVAQTLGFLPDLAGAGMRAVGLPSSAPGQYTDWARKGIAALIGKPPFQPETEAERVLYAGGKGVGDAASVAIPAAGVANAARAGGTTSNIARALAAQPGTQLAAGAVSGAVGEATDSPTAGLVSALLTPAVMSAGTRAVLPVRPNVPAETQRLLSVADAEGIPLTAGQRSGSKPLKWLESAFDNLPLTAGPQAAIREGQNAAFTSAAASRAGIAGTSLDRNVLAANNARLGSVFDNVSNATTVNLDNQFLDELTDITTRYARKLPSQQRPSFDAYVDDILNTGGQMPGTMYQQARSDMTRQARSMRNSDPFYADTLRRLRNALDDAFDRSVPAEHRDALRTAREQYHYQKLLENAMAGPGEVSAAGQLPPAQLRSAVVNGDRGAYARGEGELNDLARVGQAFLKPLPDSGTTNRNYMQGLLTGALPGGAGTAALAAGAEPLTAALMAGATLAGPRAVQGVYNQPWMQHYLLNGIPGLAPLAQQAPQMNRALVAALMAEKARNAEVELAGASRPALPAR